MQQERIFYVSEVLNLDIMKIKYITSIFIITYALIQRRSYRTRKSGVKAST